MKFCKLCKKLCHETEIDAIIFQQMRYDKPFYAYPCPRSSGYWHISTNGLPDRLMIELAEMIQNSDSFFIRRISNRVAIHLVEHHGGTFLVKYMGRSHQAEIIDEVVLNTA